MTNEERIQGIEEQYNVSLGINYHVFESDGTFSDGFCEKEDAVREAKKLHGSYKCVIFIDYKEFSGKNLREALSNVTAYLEYEETKAKEKAEEQSEKKQFNVHSTFSGIYSFCDIINNYCDKEFYDNADEAYEAFCKDYSDELKEYSKAPKLYASAILNDWYKGE